MAAYRWIFCNWNVIYTGLAPDADLCVARLLGTILRIICRTDHPADDYECSTIVWVFFIARLWVEYGLRDSRVSHRQPVLATSTYMVSNLWKLGSVGIEGSSACSSGFPAEFQRPNAGTLGTKRSSVPAKGCCADAGGSH